MAGEKGRTYELLDSLWDKSIIPSLEEYIRIPNQSPMFDKDWATNGHQDKAIELLVDWVKKMDVKGLSIEVVREEGRTPLIFMEITATKPECKETVMLYGHMDKQPPMTETWDPKYGGPWDPRIIEGRLYGRGGADDGYSTFAAVGAIAALQAQDIPHSRCVVTIEACEESQSVDLPHYIEVLADRIGVPNLVICLDSGCETYDRLWLTTSLRGFCAGNLKVEILQEGVHSGKASGIVPSTFRILRQLLARIEDQDTGEMLVKELYGDIPEERFKQAVNAGSELGDHIFKQFPFVENAAPVSAKDNSELLLNGTWRPTLCITGIDGLPPLASAGNVLRPKTVAKLSVRLPPNVDPSHAADALKKVLEKDPPYGAKVEFEVDCKGAGWNAPSLQPWLKEAVDAASTKYYSKPARMIGEGGSIPFMGLLSSKFAGTQFMVTGLLGPESNAHGPNECLCIEMGKKVTCCVAEVLSAHCKHYSQ